jgi:hypothetical protein
MNSVIQHRVGEPERGAVLIISLILLVVLTLFALAAMNFTNVQSRIAGNLQVRTELKAANQQAIEQVISANFTANPGDTDVFFDVNGDGNDDYKVTVSHTCVSSITIPADSLDPFNKPLDAQCTMGGPETSPGIEGASPSTASLCAESLWDVQASGRDASTATFATAAKLITHQGISLRVSVGTSC